MTELRNRLKDPSEKVRLYAACFLTEYQEASGLPEMRKALTRFKNIDSAHGADLFEYSFQMEMLLASFERITGKSFGEIPLPLALVSVPQGERQRYKELIDTWHAWWTWQPDGQGAKNP